MKQYLEALANEIDYVTSEMDGARDYKEQIIGVIYKHLKDEPIKKIFKNMKKAIK